ncbi:hypothetical protein [Tunicatimonas pelagia]|uniref:hypothetical protein n=1 Tax=Tunicatimonas pelagia TaxID=931531 RepID=UPI00266668DE|nr:hypothetical protein [Tunicatimonas pelagia]WKN42073.1 hypothetical protein P0M28_23840 [Tunicatimonas pelagia]
MKYCLLISLLVLLLTSASAQDVMPLRAITFAPMITERIYVASVTDERKKKSLGVHKTLSKEKRELFLQDGALAVQRFYDLSFQKSNSSTPIHIKVLALNVQESLRRMNNGVVRVARAHVSLVFGIEQNGVFTEVFRIKHNEDEVFGRGDREGLYATHEKRVRAALEYCMHAFLSSYSEMKDEVASADFLPIKMNGRLETKLGEWFNLVTVKGLRSRYFEGYGVTYTGFVDRKKGFIRPYEISFEVDWARADIAEERGYNDVNSFTFRPELYFVYKKLFKGVYASLSGNVPIGYELLERKNGDSAFNFIIGIGASQGLRFVPWQNRGVVFGADFFQQFETSRVYRFDMGVEVVLGVNF